MAQFFYSQSERGQDESRAPVFVVGEDGPVGGSSDDETVAEQDQEHPDDPRQMVQQPAKVMRIGTMVKQLLEEVRAAPLDEPSRGRLKEIHQSSIAELKQGLAPELVEELERLALPFTQDETPSEAELRIAQAQLVGWLEGLFQGLQTALFAQQMAARGQLEHMQRGLPAGGNQQENGSPQGTGQYL